MGSVYLRGGTWWLKYYRAGKPFRQSAKTKIKAEAVRLLKFKEGQIATGTFPGLRVERIRFDEIAEDIITDYKVNGRRSLDRAELSVSHLKKWFSGMKAADITSDRVQTYIVSRKEEGAANGTVNLELAALKRIFRLAAKQTPPKVSRIPFIPMLEPAPAREGFFERDEFLALRGALPDRLRVLATVAFYTGMRRGELLSLRWEQVNLAEKKVTLRAANTKTKRPRTIYLDGELLEAVEKQKAYRDWTAPSCPWVFFRLAGVKGKKTAQPLKDFRAAWEMACQRVGLVGRKLHDFRRTGIRNLVRAGVPEKVAMEISGHRTRAVFDRYDITTEEDKRLAASKVAAMFKPEMGTNPGTIAPKEAKDGTPMEDREAR